MSGIDPDALAAAKEQIASGGADAGPVIEAARELAETHGEVFVQRMVSYNGKPGEVVQFTMAYFQALKEEIDKAIMASPDLEQ